MNLREEPIIFINGKPYSLRNISDMINNLIYTGIDSLGLFGRGLIGREEEVQAGHSARSRCESIHDYGEPRNGQESERDAPHSSHRKLGNHCKN